MWIQTAEQQTRQSRGSSFPCIRHDGSKLLPRPISICEIDRTTGNASGGLSCDRRKYRNGAVFKAEIRGYDPGDRTAWEMDSRTKKQKERKSFLMGGGIGVPPILELAKQMKCEKKQILAGYRDAQTFLKEEFEANGELYISTEDGSVGTKGNVMDAIRENGLKADMIYACGPTPMLRAIKQYAEEQGIECYISLEERMACGIGACLACVCRSKEKDAHSNVNNKRICKDGPVFLADGGGDLMDMSVKIAGVEWKNPVTVASGTFGSGEEFSEFVDLNRLGAVMTKGVANVPWPGNPTPRVAEVYGGMMNAIGLQNPGIDLFCKRDIPYLKKFDTKIIVNVCGHAPEEYLEVVERLADEPIDMMEINISCPNVNAGFLAFGQDAKHVEELTGQIKKIAKQPIIMKLTPNVTDITEIAKAAEAGGADAVSLINTLTGMKIDINRKTFAVANKTGGVSGPIVKPIAVRMVYQVAQAVNIPIIGMGGISCAEDAIEFLLAGASAVSVGTANFHDPAVTLKVINGIEAYMKKNGFETVKDMVGIVK